MITTMRRKKSTILEGDTTLAPNITRDITMSSQVLLILTPLQCTRILAQKHVSRPDIPSLGEMMFPTSLVPQLYPSPDTTAIETMLS
jgi:hypothetical protein